MAIRHAKVSAASDSGDPALVQASDWNDDHDVDGLATPADVADAVAAHASAEPHLEAPDLSSYATGVNVDAAIAAHLATEPHEEPPAPVQAFPVGAVFLAVVSTSPATLLGYGTWAAFGGGRMLAGFNAGDPDFDTVEETGGAKTHTHAGHTDHGALTHTGATVGAHSFTQPSAHSDHGALTHAGATVGNHTDVTNHVHVQNTNSAATGGLVGSAPDTSTSTSVASGYSTANPTSVGVAAMVHTVGQASQHAAQSHSAHTGGGVDAHSVGQASQHAAQSHSAHDSPSSLPPYVVVYMWKRTA